MSTNPTADIMSIDHQVGNFLQVPALTSGTSGTTKFADDTLGNDLELARPVELHGSLPSIVQISGADDIKAFLMKPVRVGRGSITATVTGNFVTVDVWKVLMEDAQNALKIKGVYLVRADIRVRVVMNATRFQQGRFMLAHIPSGGLPVAAPQYVQLSKMHLNNIRTVSTLPHVEMDLASQTHMEMIVPYQTVYPMMTNRTTITNSLGNVYLYAYVPLASGSGSTSCPWSMYANFENIVLSMPTVNQSGYEYAEQQSGSSQSLEQMSRGAGPISSTIAKVANAASELGPLPIIGNYAKNVAWIGKHVARAALALGFSKPIDVGKPQRVLRNIVPHIANVDTFSMSQPIAACSDNEVVVDSGVAKTGYDEMSLSFVARQFGWLKTVVWDTTILADANITTINLRLSELYGITGKGITPLPFNLVSRFFRYYRGGWRLRFKLVKTEFHSGRFLVGFVPTDADYTTQIGTGLGNFLYRQLIDVREVNEFDVCIPYVTQNLYLRPDQTLGNLIITVVDPLIAPDVVTSSISIICEIAADEDVEFAYPVGADYDAYVPAVAQSGYAAVPCFELGPRSKALDFTPSSVAIGEKITSFRQLLKRFYFGENKALVAMTTADCALYYPYFNTLVSQITDNTTPLLRSTTGGNDNISLLSASYLFSSGGMRVLVRSGGTGKITSIGMFNFDGATAITTTSAFTFQSVGSMRSLHDADVEPVIDVTTPMYHHAIARINAAQLLNNVSGLFTPSSDNYASSSLYVIARELDSPAASTPAYTFFRMLADDASLSGWYGVVPIVARGTV
jgi:hypothetical protein